MSGAATNLNVIKCDPITIAQGATTSSIVPRGVFGDAETVTIYAPATMAETVTFDVTYDNPATAGGNWVTWNNNVADVSGPAAGKAIVYPAMDFMAFRLKLNTGAAVAHTFQMTKKA